MVISLKILINILGGKLMKKRLLSMLLCMAVLGTALMGCSKEDTKSPASNASSGKTSTASGSSKSAASKSDKSDIKVAGVVFLEDQFMKLMLAGFQAAAEEAGVSYVYGNCSNDQTKETELINSYVAQGINGIAIAPLSEKSSVASLKAASEKGLKIALTDGVLKEADFITTGYTSDQYQLGHSTGKAAKKFIEEKLDGKAKIAIIQLKSLLPEKSAQRVGGFLDMVKELKGVEVVADQDAWVQDEAVSVVSDILTANLDIDVIYAANEGGTVGATMAVKNVGKAGKVFTFGIDANEQLAKMLLSDDNILQATTGQDSFTMGYNSMKELIEAIKAGDAAKKGSTQFVDGILLERDDKDGINKYLDRLSELSK